MDGENFMVPTLWTNGWFGGVKAPIVWWATSTSKLKLPNSNWSCRTLMEDWSFPKTQGRLEVCLLPFKKVSRNASKKGFFGFVNWLLFFFLRKKTTKTSTTTTRTAWEHQEALITRLRQLLAEDSSLGLGIWVPRFIRRFGKAAIWSLEFWVGNPARKPPGMVLKPCKQWD